jgi:hypothetical protein
MDDEEEQYVVELETQGGGGETFEKGVEKRLRDELKKHVRHALQHASALGLPMVIAFGCNKVEEAERIAAEEAAAAAAAAAAEPDPTVLVIGDEEAVPKAGGEATGDGAGAEESSTYRKFKFFFGTADTDSIVSNEKALDEALRTVAVTPLELPVKDRLHQLAVRFKYLYGSHTKAGRLGHMTLDGLKQFVYGYYALGYDIPEDIVDQLRTLDNFEEYEGPIRFYPVAEKEIARSIKSVLLNHADGRASEEVKAKRSAQMMKYNEARKNRKLAEGTEIEIE